MSTKSGKNNTGAIQKSNTSSNNSQPSKSSSLSNSSWSTVTRALNAKHTTQLAQPGPTANDNEADDVEEFITVTLACFQKFQQPVFALITHLVFEHSAITNRFTEKWKAALNHALPFNEFSTFRTITKILGFKELNQYCAFVLECPGIDRRLIMRDSAYTTNGFDFRFLQQEIPNPKQISHDKPKINTDKKEVKKKHDESDAVHPNEIQQEESKSADDTHKDPAMFSQCAGSDDYENVSSTTMDTPHEADDSIQDTKSPLQNFKHSRKTVILYFTLLIKQ